MSMDKIREAILNGASSEVFSSLEIPKTYRAAHIRADEQEMFKGLSSNEKDPRQSIHVGEVPTPEIAPDEVLMAVMASSINFNTVWSSIFEPVSSFGALTRLAHDQGAPGR